MTKSTKFELTAAETLSLMRFRTRALIASFPGDQEQLIDALDHYPVASDFALFGEDSDIREYLIGITRIESAFEQVRSEQRPLPRSFFTATKVLLIAHSRAITIGLSVGLALGWIASCPWCPVNCTAFAY
ncbi:MAG: hypothetical protein EVA65_16055 [Oceanococcus sp.]|nr:MAG: hypothetical protein EVA65_16055 [Oceanococcus sp.]